MSLRAAAFFDIDNTLIDIKSMFSFQSYYFRHAPEHEGQDPELLDLDFQKSLATNAPLSNRAALNRAYYRSFAGRCPADVARIAKDWFVAMRAAKGDSLWIKETLALAERQRSEGFLRVGVTGASHEIVAPIIEALEFDGVLAATLEQRNGIFTGELIPPQTIGPGKKEAIEQFALAAHIDLQISTACGDHLTDLPMLESTGHAFVVRGDAELEREAILRGWPLLDAPTVAMSDLHI